jgi:imidazolonepropionase-like amidohydrolase
MTELGKAGMSTLEVLHAATWGARQWLGRPGIEEGEDADLVVYGADPREDVTVVADPKGIVLRGRVVL